MFLLQAAAGRVDPNQVLKIFKTGVGGLFGVTNLEREWRVGRQLALLAEPGNALPGSWGLVQERSLQVAYSEVTYSAMMQLSLFVSISNFPSYALNLAFQLQRW